MEMVCSCRFCFGNNNLRVQVVPIEIPAILFLVIIIFKELKYAGLSSSIFPLRTCQSECRKACTFISLEEA